jgi:hypothetical protein
MKIESVPFVFVCVSPCARFPNSFPKAVVQVSRKIGSLTSFWYRVMVAPVIGWITGLAKCSISMSKLSLCAVGQAERKDDGVPISWSTVAAR